MAHRTSRGIGLEITKQLLECTDASVLVACRSPSEASALKDIATFAGKHLRVLHLDVNDAQSIKDAAGEAAEIVGEKGVDYLINNAGVVRPPPSLPLSTLLIPLPLPLPLPDQPTTGTLC